MRAVLRVSITGEQNGALRNALVAVAEKHGFKTDPGGANTGTWQTHSITEQQYAAFISEYWNAIANHAGPGRLDHIWTMTDQWSYPANTDKWLEEQIQAVGVGGQ
jgi:hypothetical protein